MFTPLLVLHRMCNIYTDDGSHGLGVLTMCQACAWSHLIISIPPEAGASGSPI